MICTTDSLCRRSDETGDGTASPLRTGWAIRYDRCDEHRVAQGGIKRVTIWKTICLLFWSRGANRCEGAGSEAMLMDWCEIGLCGLCELNRVYNTTLASAGCGLPHRIDHPGGHRRYEHRHETLGRAGQRWIINRIGLVAPADQQPHPSIGMGHHLHHCVLPSYLK
jgi:hypothetical protein